MSKFLFIEMDKNIGRVINHYLATCANDHILCVLVGHFMPNQKEIKHRQEELDTKHYIGLMIWLLQVSAHEGFSNVTPPEGCSQP